VLSASCKHHSSPRTCIPTPRPFSFPMVPRKQAEFGLETLSDFPHRPLPSARLPPPHALLVANVCIARPIERLGSTNGPSSRPRFLSLRPYLLPGSWPRGLSTLFWHYALLSLAPLSFTSTRSLSLVFACSFSRAVS